MNEVLDMLTKSKFRSSFYLNSKMKDYVYSKGIDKIRSHAIDFVNKRLKVYDVIKDGKQTPMRQTHPVFIAQHATATCCRGCIFKWHHIPKDKELSNKEINYIVDIIIEWIKRETKVQWKWTFFNEKEGK